MEKKNVTDIGLGLFLIILGIGIILPKFNPPPAAPDPNACEQDDNEDQENCKEHHSGNVGVSGGRQKAVTQEEIKSAGHAGFGENAVAHGGGGE